MSQIKVLVVADGLYSSPTQDGISFADGQDPTDDTFTVSEFLYLLQNSTAADISVDTAHRRSSAGATFQNFNFATTDLSQYDVIWIFGYEGFNAGYTGTAIGEDEILAITQFMNAGGGVFATGDHLGMGSYICGEIPRVRTMRKWFGQAGDLPADYPATALNYAGASVTSVNWQGLSSTTLGSRADTVQKNPSDSATEFAFEDQSDNIPQSLAVLGAVHPILQGPNGTINRFPDHMHEGEVVTPASLAQVLLIDGNPIAEYPSVGSNQPAPRVIATGSFVPGHTTKVDQNTVTCVQVNFATDTTPTPSGTIGTVCVYDGRPVGVGRVVTDSSFHHYLDLNLNGDPCGSTPDRKAGFGPPKTKPAAGGVLADLQAFYVNTVVWLAKPVQDCRLVLDKTTFGEDEVTSIASYPAAGWVEIDGCSANDLGLNAGNLANPPPGRLPTISLTFDPTLSGAELAALKSMLQVAPLINATQPVVPMVPLTSSNLGEAQTFFYPVAVSFAGTAGFTALGSGGQTLVEVSASATTVGGVTVGNSAELTLTSAEDPFFEDVDPTDLSQPYWLSFDLRFFKMAVTPDGTASLFNATIGTDPTNATTGAPAFITNVIGQLNTNNAAIGGDAWFAGLPQLEESAKMEFQQQDDSGNYAFNFAVARVRLQTSAAATAKMVRVFFRLFQAQNTVSNFDTATTYRFADGPQYGHKIPLLGVQNDEKGNPEYVTIPCFAAPRINLDGPADMQDQDDAANAFDISTTGGGEVYRYFACWVDINQPQQVFLPASPPSATSGESVDGPWTSEWQHPATELQSIQTAITAAPHQCLVAEIRFDDTPVAAGATTGTSDKLAQRNIAWIDGPNPGAVASRLMPHPIQVRPTPADAENPDELMILWGNTPKASEAQLYLPALDATNIIHLADLRYATHRLRRVDAHTISCPAEDATLIPLPAGTALAAGLLSVALPAGIRKGEQYAIDVRQLTDATATLRQPPPPPQIQIAGAPRASAATVAPPATEITWRRVLGGCRFAIAISTKEELLLPEERLLAVLRWIAQKMPHGKRWYPVLLRYIGDIAGRVQGFGGDPTKILPSPTGQVPGWPLPHPAPGGGHGGDTYEVTGKIEGIVYDHFGDFEGFILETESGHHHRFASREEPMQRVANAALNRRARVTVMSERHRPHEALRIVLHAAPMPEWE